MIIDRAWFAAKQAALEAKQKEVLANYNAIEGAIQFCQKATAEIDAELGLPLEQLFPGAVIDTGGEPNGH